MSQENLDVVASGRQGDPAGERSRSHQALEPVRLREYATFTKSAKERVEVWPH